MNTSTWMMVVLVGAPSPLLSAQDGKFAGSLAAYLDKDHSVNLQIPYVTSPPGGAAQYLFCGSAGVNPWRVYWSKSKTDKSTRAAVSCVTDSPATRNLVVKLAAPVPGDEAVSAYYWTVLFAPPDGSSLLPQLFASTPNQGPAMSQGKKSCDNKDPLARPAFCAPAAGVPADVSVTGSFLAAGQTKPIYKLEVLAGLYKPRPVSWLWNFNPGINLAVEVNQNAKPPNNRTTFDPDSIIAAAALMKIVPIQKGILYGMQFDEFLPSGEFSRSDPSSNLIFKTSAMFVLNPWHPRKQRFYGTLYPVLAYEGGKNLNRPSMLAKRPIDLTRYDGIARGVLGADATLGFASSDKKTDDITLTGSYRVRLPAFDEPFIRTEHQVTMVDLTTKARHWVEVDLSYSPSIFKYLAITAQYQYGDLPPVFKLVDHKVSIGLTFKASQTNKATLPSPVK